MEQAMSDAVRDPLPSVGGKLFTYSHERGEAMLWGPPDKGTHFI